MKDENEKIKGLGPRRDRTCYQTMQDIVIPKGTILRSAGENKFSCAVGINSIVVSANFSVVVPPADADRIGGDVIKRVVAA